MLVCLSRSVAYLWDWFNSLRIVIVSVYYLINNKNILCLYIADSE